MTKKVFLFDVDCVSTDSGELQTGVVDLINALKDIGYIVFLVSNRKCSDIESFCRTVKLEGIIKERLYVGLEDFDSQVKPSPVPYIVAAKRLNILPEECIVFETSRDGVISAKRAGMYVVGLQRSVPAEILSDMGADEVVTNILHAQILPDAMFAKPDLSVTFDGITTRFITMQKIEEKVQQQIVDSTYDIYKTLFSGRTRNEWQEKIIDPKDLQTRLGLFYSEKNLVGYAILKCKLVVYKGEQRIVKLGSVGMMENFRSNNAMARFFQMEFRRFAIANPGKVVDMFDCYLGYPGYSLALRSFHTVYPSSRNPICNTDILDYMNYLANFVGYTKAKFESPFAYLSKSKISITSQERERLLASEDLDCKYFGSQTQFLDGHGLLAICPVQLSNLKPMLSSCTATKEEKNSQLILKFTGSKNSTINTIFHSPEIEKKLMITSKI